MLSGRMLDPPAGPFFSARPDPEGIGGFAILTLTLPSETLPAQVDNVRVELTWGATTAISSGAN